MGLELDFVMELKQKGASERDIAYASANIPKEFWDITRASINITAGDKKVFEYVTSYVDTLDNMIANGSGLSMIGPSKVGKTLFGCAILKSAAINPCSMQRDYRVQRVNYDTILEDLNSLRHDEAYGDLKNMLTRCDILFLDSITVTPANSALLSIMRTRRDFKKSTILAATCDDFSIFNGTRAKEIFGMFSDINKTYHVTKG
jgi:DNA replication protein DnaC